MREKSYLAQLGQAFRRVPISGSEALPRVPRELARRRREAPVADSDGAAERARVREALTGKVFICIGAQKAGTTWLDALLCEYPDCAMPAVKEMHFFDTKYQPTLRHNERYLDRVQSAAKIVAGLEKDIRDHLALRDRADGALFEDGFLDGVDFKERAKRILHIVELLQVHDMDSYLGYLNRLREQRRAAIVGEITPSYALLTADVFREIDQRMPNCRFIFIMRDPVERLWSQLRGAEKKKKTGRRTEVSGTGIEAALGDPEVRGRSDYERTITALEGAVAPERIHYGFFESLTDPAHAMAEIRAIERFLGLAPLSDERVHQRVARPLNKSPESALSVDERKRVAEALLPTYEFVQRKFGRLPEGWMKL